MVPVPAEWCGSRRCGGSRRRGVLDDALGDAALARTARRSLQAAGVREGHPSFRSPGTLDHAGEASADPTRVGLVWPGPRTQASLWALSPRSPACRNVLHPPLDLRLLEVVLPPGIDERRRSEELSKTIESSKHRFGRAPSTQPPSLRNEPPLARAGAAARARGGTRARPPRALPRSMSRQRIVLDAARAVDRVIGRALSRF